MSFVAFVAWGSEENSRKRETAPAGIPKTKHRRGTNDHFVLKSHQRAVRLLVGTARYESPMVRNVENIFCGERHDKCALGARFRRTM